MMTKLAVDTVLNAGKKHSLTLVNTARHVESTHIPQRLLPFVPCRFFSSSTHLSGNSRSRDVEGWVVLPDSTKFSAKSFTEKKEDIIFVDEKNAVSSWKRRRDWRIESPSFYTTQQRRHSTIAAPHQKEEDCLTEVEAKEQLSALTAQLKKHAAYEHPLFGYMQERAEEKSLSSEQFDFFRHTMFSRIHPTVVSIAIQLSIAAKQGDYNTLWTAAQNVHEETGEGVLGKSHPELCMSAFNTLGRHFKLPSTTLAYEYGKEITTKEVHYHAVIDDLYKRHPILVSYAQELASAGNENTAGMMGDIYNVFYPYRDEMDTRLFNELILPYFAGHCNIDSDGRLLPTTDSVEDVHRQRAEEDVLRTLTKKGDIATASVVMHSFAEAQSDLFFQALEIIEGMDRKKGKKGQGGVGVIIADEDVVLLSKEGKRASYVQRLQEEEEEIKKGCMERWS